MKKIIIYIITLLIFAGISFLYGLILGKKQATIKEVEKIVTVYKERENNTLEHEKTAEIIKIKYMRFENANKECDFVLNYNVNKCLPK